MKRTVIVNLLTLIVALPLIAERISAGSFSGRILDISERTTLSGATIYLANENRYVRTDDKGAYDFTIANDTVRVTVSHVGFMTQRNLILVSGANQVIQLAPIESVLGSIVVTANRYAKEAYKAAQPIAALSGGEIASRGHVTVTQAIQQLAGVDVTDGGPFRARPIIRGLSGSRVLVLVDGERLNDFRESNNFAGVSLSLVDPHEVERVEVVNGPTSVLYGSDAMAGVVNIITQQSKFSDTLRPVLSYTGRYSTADEQNSNRFDLGFSAARFSATVGLQYREARNDLAPPDGWNKNSQFAAFRSSFYDSLNAARGTSFSNDRLVSTRARINNYDARGAYKLSDKHRLDFDLGFFRGNDIGYPGVPNVATPFLFYYPDHSRENFAVSYSGRGITNRMLRMDSRIFYQKIEKTFFTDFLGSIPPIPLGPPGSPTLTPLTVDNRTEVTKFGWNFQELYRLSSRMTAAFGFDALREKIAGNNLERSAIDPPGPAPAVIDESKSTPVPENAWSSLGVFVSPELSIGRLSLNGGVRYDNFWVSTEASPLYLDDSNEPLPTREVHHDAVNGSLGAVFTLSNDVNLVGHVGTAYRVPNVVEQFYFGSASGRETRPNPDIKPERSTALDLGIKGTHGYLSYSLIGFYGFYDNFIQFANFDSIPQGPGRFQKLWRYENFEEVAIRGFESNAELRLENGLYGTFSFTYQHGTIRSENNEPLFVSPIRTVVSGGYRHAKTGLYFDATVDRTEDQRLVPKVAYLDDIATRGFTVVNTSVGIHVWERVRLTLAINNVFDELYSEPFNARVPDNPIPEPGRNLIVSLSSSL